MSNSAEPQTRTLSPATRLAKAPEILAPVGAREQFFAALHSGADAVFLGLKQFNARARAGNFTIEELQELVPLAHRFEMKVLVTLNILIKQEELPQLIETLSALEMLGVDAIIVQDAGVVRLVKEFFPGLRLHASTQFAVHSAAGAVMAEKMGFRRIVLAREMTAQEIRMVRKELPREKAEIEAFCHGSLCYSYSGLCFFSGAADARSGNRGECAYTCRKPYKILSEPGHGFLFSMKDLNTVQDLDLLVEAGVDTLKIEGRKKDAQYVATSVGIYRKRLDELYERSTLRVPAPDSAKSRDLQNVEQDAKYSFQREGTSLFVKGRYHENVIDLDNPGHKGVLAGKVLSVPYAGKVEVELSTEVQRFDGLKVLPGKEIFHATPQHGERVNSSAASLQGRYERNSGSEFSLRSMENRTGQRLSKAESDQTILLEIPEEIKVEEGDLIFKTRSADLKERITPLTQPMGDERLEASTPVEIQLTVQKVGAQEAVLRVLCTARKNGTTVCEKQFEFPFQRAQKPGVEENLKDSFSFWGENKLRAESFCLNFEDPEAKEAFLPKSVLKSWKKEFGNAVSLGIESFAAQKKQAALKSLVQPKSLPFADHASLSVKVDRLETLRSVVQMAKSLALEKNDFKGSSKVRLQEIVFEPKRAFLPSVSAEDLVDQLLEAVEGGDSPLHLRMALPTVVRAWDEALLKRWVQVALAKGVRRFELGNVGAIELFRRWSASYEAQEMDLSSDFTLYCLNNPAAEEWASQGLSTLALSIESDKTDLRQQLESWGVSKAVPQIILYKDTPLFVAESCSLTALHNGCPTAKVCGYRTLEIENDAGERFFVSHESCKSIVFAEQAYAVCQHLEDYLSWGVRHLRVDFLTRDYLPADVQRILHSAIFGLPVEHTHEANFSRRLL